MARDPQARRTPLSEIDRLDPDRAARLGSQLAAQLAALDESGASPEAILAESVMLEGVGDGERAWLLPDLFSPRSQPTRPRRRARSSRFSTAAPAPRSSPTPRPTLRRSRPSLLGLEPRRHAPAGSSFSAAAAFGSWPRCWSPSSRWWPCHVTALRRPIRTRRRDRDCPHSRRSGDRRVDRGLRHGVDRYARGKLVRVDAKTNSVVGAAQPRVPRAMSTSRAAAAGLGGRPGQDRSARPVGEGRRDERSLGSARRQRAPRRRPLVAGDGRRRPEPARAPRPLRPRCETRGRAERAIRDLRDSGADEQRHRLGGRGDAAFTEIRPGSTETIAVAGEAGFPSTGLGPRLDSHPVRPHDFDHRRSGRDVARARPSFRGPATDGRGRRRLDVGADEGPEHALPGRPGISATPREAVARSGRSGLCEVRGRLALARRPEVRRARPNRAGDTRPGRSSRRGAG